MNEEIKDDIIVNKEEGELADVDDDVNEEAVEEIPKKERVKALKNWFKNSPPVKEEQVLKVSRKKKVLSQNEMAVSGRNWKQKGLIFAQVLAVVLLMVSIIGNAYLYKKYNIELNRLSDSVSGVQKITGADKEKIDKISIQVGRIYTALNLSESAQKTSDKAIPDASANNTASTGEIKVAIYNGTTTVGLAKEMQKTLEEKLASAKVVTLDNAKHSNYTKTTVVAIGNKAAEAKQVAEVIGGQFNILPLDEEKPDADVLVVVGK